MGFTCEGINNKRINICLNVKFVKFVNSETVEMQGKNLEGELSIGSDIQRLIRFMGFHVNDKKLSDFLS